MESAGAKDTHICIFIHVYMYTFIYTDKNIHIEQDWPMGVEISPLAVLRRSTWSTRCAVGSGTVVSLGPVTRFVHASAARLCARERDPHGRGARREHEKFTDADASLSRSPKSSWQTAIFANGIPRRSSDGGVQGDFRESNLPYPPSPDGPNGTTPKSQSRSPSGTSYNR